MPPPRAQAAISSRSAAVASKRGRSRSRISITLTSRPLMKICLTWIPNWTNRTAIAAKAAAGTVITTLMRRVNDARVLFTRPRVIVVSVLTATTHVPALSGTGRTNR